MTETLTFVRGVEPGKAVIDRLTHINRRDLHGLIDVQMVETWCHKKLQGHSADRRRAERRGSLLSVLEECAMHTVTATEEIWIRASGRVWHKAKPGAVIELGFSAWGICETYLRSVVQISTTRPTRFAMCKRCARQK